MSNLNLDMHTPTELFDFTLCTVHFSFSYKQASGFKKLLAIASLRFVPPPYGHLPHYDNNWLSCYESSYYC